MFRTVGALVALLALLALARPATAAPPVVETFHDEASGAFQEPCPNGVTLLFTRIEDVRVTTYFDQAGNPIRLKIKVDVDGEVTNPETGQSVENVAHTTIFEDLVAGTVVQVGLVFKATVPGVGVVLHDVGRVVSDAAGNLIFEAGPHDVLNTAGDHAVRTNFCAALT
jgi:hypothetical protein